MYYVCVYVCTYIYIYVCMYVHGEGRRGNNSPPPPCLISGEQLTTGRAHYHILRISQFFSTTAVCTYYVTVNERGMQALAPWVMSTGTSTMIFSRNIIGASCERTLMSILDKTFIT